MQRPWLKFVACGTVCLAWASPGREGVQTCHAQTASERAVAKNTATENTAAENTAAENTASEKTASENDAADSPTIRWRVGREGRADAVEIAGLPRDLLARLAQRPLDDEAWRRIFPVGVADDMDSGDPRPMLGTWGVRDDSVWFEPRYPLRPGTAYRAVFHGAQVTGEGEPAIELRGQYERRTESPAGPAQIVAVYPTADVLPENQLKFYLHFSAPMSRGEAYQRVTLRDGDGREVDFPFLELGEELWDPSGTRFTLFFDPGRIKRGLKPRELFGPALLEGQEYTFEVAEAWRDANGRPLTKPFVKRFRVTAPDEQQPDPAKWRLTAPVAGTRQPLTITFDEPLDHAMLSRVLTPKHGGERVSGSVSIGRGETSWTFLPEQPWAAGDYVVAVDAALEDRAGNSIGRPFEVDVFDRVERNEQPEFVEVPFEVVARECR